MADSPGSADLVSRAWDVVIELLMAGVSQMADLVGREPVAIVGAACRLPGGVNSPAELWRALVAGCDLVTEVPCDRFDAGQLVDPQWQSPGTIPHTAGGFLDDLTGFDAEFFGISPVEASRMDPQQRIVLELAVEALEDAGVDPYGLAGSCTAVVVGVSMPEYLQMQHHDRFNANGYTMTGGVLSLVAQRVSHALDLRGPSFIVDTACASSLSALHQACQLLWMGDSRLVLVGGVSVILNPMVTVGHAAFRALSATGRCRTFSAAADGFVRSEGGGLFAVKLLRDAIADGDRVRAVIAGIGTNFDGHTAGISHPNREAQEQLLRSLYPACGVEPGDVSYVETHGTGTPVGDAVECAAVGAVLGRSRSADSPLAVGSVKSNLGHLESGAGAAGLLKALLVLEHGQIPESLHAEPLNPAIDFAGLGLAPVTELRELPGNGRGAVGVNSFGIGGGNVHVVLRPAPTCTDTPVEPPGGLPIVVSGRSEEAVIQAAHAMADRLGAASDDDAYDICYTACRRRGRYEFATAAVAGDRASLAGRLEAAAEGPVPGTASGTSRGTGKVAFVFSGNGSQWVGMGTELLRRDAAFAASLREVDEASAEHLGWSVARTLTTVTDRELARSAYAMPLLFAVQVGIVAALRERGVRAAMVFGHSLGELAAAYTAGALDLATACRYVALRGRYSELAAGLGGMAAVGVPEERALELVDGFSIELAAVNSPADVTLSGDKGKLELLGERLAGNGVFFRMLEVDYPYHGHEMDTPASHVREEMADMVAGPVRIPMISTVTGQHATGRDLDIGYWCRTMRERVRFADAVTLAAAEGYGTFLEIGPHPVLRAYLRRTSMPDSRPPSVVGTLHRQGDPMADLDGAVAGVLAAGGELDWERYFPRPGRVVDLPGYRWQREQHWTGDPMAWTPPLAHPLLGVRQPGVDPAWLGRLDPVRLPWLTEHTFDGQPLMPATGFVEIALAAGQHTWEVPAEVEHIDLASPLVLAPAGTPPTITEVAVDADDGTFRVSSRDGEDQPWRVHVRARLRRHVAEPPPDVDLAAWQDTMVDLDHTPFYRPANGHGVEWGPTFQVLRTVRQAGSRVYMHYRFTDTADDHKSFEVHPALLDGALQGACLLLPEAVERRMLPAFIDRVQRWARPALEGCFLVRVSKRTERDIVAEVTVTDLEGRVSMRMTGIRVRLGDHSSPDTPEVMRTVLRAAAHQPDALPPLPAPSAVRDHLPQPIGSIEAVRFVATAARVNAHFAAAALSDMAGSDGWTIPALLHAGLLSKYEPLVRALTALAIRNGTLTPVPGDTPGWRLAGTPDPEGVFTRALREFSGFIGYWALAGECGLFLADVLRGERDPLDLLFPAQVATGAEAVYDCEPMVGQYSTVARHALAALTAMTPMDRPLRVLEVGAGTGRTTVRVLPGLAPERTRYLVTDVSASFLQRAKAQFGRYDWVDYGTFDLDTDPAEQGYQEGSFDVVVAGIALHTAVDLARALSHLTWLLADGGHLLLVEIHDADLCTPLFGLLDSWWTSADTDLRPNSPVLSHQQWTHLLEKHGYSDVVRLTPGTASNEVGSVLLAARPRRAVLPRSAPTSEECHLVVGGTGSALAEALAHALPGGIRAATWPDLTQVIPRHAEAVTILLLTDVWSARANATSTDTIVADVTALRHLAAETRSMSVPPRLVVLTPSAGIFDQFNDPVDIPTAAGLWGAARTLANERPALTVLRVALGPGTPQEQATRVAAELAVPGLVEDEVVLTRQGRFVPRVVTLERSDVITTKAKVAAGGPVRLHSNGRGPAGLTWIPASTPAIGPHEVAVRVRAAAFNYRDALWTQGMLSMESARTTIMADVEAVGGVGLDVAGEVVTVGSAVTRWCPGDRVFGYALPAFASHTVALEDYLGLIPEQMAFTEAATIPAVWHTVLHSLIHRMALTEDQTVLVHAGAGGVGLAAIQHARQVGARVIATAGTPGKRALLRLLGVDQVLDSRDLSFADSVLSTTTGRGVDVVVNSLAGDGMRASIRLVRTGGHFIELGKQDRQADRHLPLGSLKAGVTIHLVDLDTLLADASQAAPGIAEVASGVWSGRCAPLPHRVFPAERVAEACDLLAHSRHVGKVVVSVDDNTPITLATPTRLPSLDRDGTYLVTGGTSGFGAATAVWLAEHGAGRVILVSRRGRAAPECSTTVDAIEAHGGQAVVIAADVTDLAAMTRVFAEIDATPAPLRGVIHAAMVLQDAPLAELDDGALRAVITPKVTGADILDRLTRDRDLDLFWLYSSISGVIGTLHQAGYVAANLHLEALARRRHAMGLPAVAVAWGVISDAGYVARELSGYVSNLLHPTTARSSLRALHQLAQHGYPSVTIGRVNWPALASTMPLAGTPRFSLVSASASTTEGSTHHAVIQAASPEQARALATEVVSQLLADIMQTTPERIDTSRPLAQLGMDSLMTVELQTALWRTLHCDLSTVRIMSSSGIADLAAHICAQLATSAGSR